MAHSTDYASRICITSSERKRLDWATQHMNSAQETNAYHLALQFCRKHSYWPLDQVTPHLMTVYSDFGMTPEIVKKAICAYMDERT